MVKIKNYFVKNYKRVEKSASKSMEISHFCMPYRTHRASGVRDKKFHKVQNCTSIPPLFDICKEKIFWFTIDPLEPRQLRPRHHYSRISLLSTLVRRNLTSVTAWIFDFYITNIKTKGLIIISMLARSIQAKKIKKIPLILDFGCRTSVHKVKAL